MFQIARGRLMNDLRRAWLAPTFEAGTEDPVFPISYAYDHRCGSAAMFADLVTDSAITIDKSVIVDGDFSTDELEGWVLDEGDVDPDGLFSVEETQQIHQDFAAVPGELWTARFDMAANESGILTIRVRNLQTGRYLNADATWTDEGADLYVSDAIEVLSLIFEVEPFEACRAHEVTLRISISGSGGQVTEVAAWPHTDLACVFGYNYAPGGLVPSVEDEGATWSSRFLRDHGSKVLWAYLGECKSDRIIRFKWTGTPLAPIGFGELVLTQTTKIARTNVLGGVAPRLDMELDSAFAQERAEAPSGALYVSPNGSDAGARRAQMSFMLTAESELIRLRDEIFAPTLGGQHPSILVGPTAIGREVCMMGRFESRLPQSYPGGPGFVICKVELGFQEDVFPRYSPPVVG
jgi:hypothetical protein